MAAASTPRAWTDRERLDALQSFKINDVCAFDTSAIDLAHTALGHAHAMNIAVGIAAETSTLRDIHLQECLNAIGGCIALARLAIDALVEKSA